MAFRFDIQEPFLKAIPRIARERIGSVIKSLGEKPRPGAEAIHDARKNLKSLRALLRLARGAIHESTRVSENAHFRDAGRALSAVRDPQALLETLGNLRKRLHSELESSKAKQTSIDAFIGKIEKEIELTLVAGLPRGQVRKIVGELREANHRAAHLFEGGVLRPGNEWESYIAVGLKQTYRKGKRLVWRFDLMGLDKAEDPDWHELRKCAKALGYQLRLLKPIWPGMIDASVEQIDHLTDQLGDANDLAILGKKILDQPYDPLETKDSGESRRIFLQSLNRRKQKLHSEAFEIARLIYAEKAGQFERRLSGYWQIWRSRVESAGNKHFSGISGQKKGLEKSDRESKEVQSSPAEVVSATSGYAPTPHVPFPPPTFGSTSVVAPSSQT
jgi:CHAD domain-containing protein